MLKRSTILEEAEHDRQRLAAVLDSITDAFFVLDHEWRFTLVNRRAAELWSRERDDLLGMDIRAVVPDTADSRFCREIARAARERRTVEFETVSPIVDGWIEVHVAPSAFGLSVYFRDISRRKQAETALRESEQRFRALIENSLDITTVLAEDGTILYDSPSVESTLGFTPEELIGQNAFALIHPDDAPVVIETFAEYIHRPGPTPTMQFRFRHKDGSWPILEARGNTVREEGRNLGMVVSSRDITERRKAADEREELLERERIARAEAEAAERRSRWLYQETERAVRARDELLSIVSHDLRNPIGTVSTSASLLLETPLPEERRTKLLEIIRRSAGRANRLVEDLLDVARIEAGRLPIDAEPEPAAVVAGEAYESLRQLAEEKGQRFECELAEGLPPVHADHDRVLQVFANLVGNAVKFTGEGGRITLGAERVGAEVRFSVSDTGPGISEADQAHLFEPYWQAKAGTREGAGLGLAITRGIVEAHGGRIWVESQEGTGSTFYFTLPVAGSARDQEAGQAAAD